MRILIIEDDAFSQELIKGRLEKDFSDECYIKMTAYLKEGEEILLKSKFDIVLLDVHLPGTDHLGTLGFIEKYKKTPIVVLTGEKNPEFFSQCIDMGARGYLSKDFKALLNLKRFLEDILADDL